MESMIPTDDAMDVDAVLDDAELVSLLSNQQPPAVDAAPFTAHFALDVSRDDIHPQLIYVSMAPGGRISAQWAETSSKHNAVASLFAKSRDSKPNRFIPVADKTKDLLQPPSDPNLCRIQEKCAAHITGCSTKCTLEFDVSELFKQSGILTVSFIFKNYTCDSQKHIRYRMYGPTRNRHALSLLPPRAAQITALHENAASVDVFSNDRSVMPSYGAARNARRLWSNDDIDEIIKIQHQRILATSNRNTSLVFAGDIHLVQRTTNYKTFSLWNEKTCLLFKKLGASRNPGVQCDATEDIVKGGYTMYRLLVPSLSGHESLSLCETFATNKEAVLFKQAMYM